MESAAPAVIELRDAYIMQDVNTVLQNVSFAVGKGEFVYLVGRTGSGKSSLLKTLYADLPLPEGMGTVVGYPLRKLSTDKVPYLRRKLGIVFQDFQLLYDRTVAQNLLFVLQATGWGDKAKMKNRVQDVLMRVGLSGVAGKMPHQLSGGEQQRVVIARALLNEPLLLLADEPTGNLDPDVTDGIMRLFMEINNAGTAVLMATHNYELIRRYPKRVLKCEKGQLLDSATTNISYTEV
ncbi:ATP-binding cassette domain-containing protein [Hymenobacter busanensis]|uniref:ATP-binding cassette domain-containing protein n=1 Tax=Hymenobacter busanensis TaxID=2607656 RepID=A0A7L4ZVD7_9BACT|nr:ATP-binding cassette domain-containing protein [Hymenobacter busanensis]KAA9339446.1 ATP-binding cassette domain-containing protein [Hymenobacter busanensis]QHJ06796.1 ATP-binding cassette domain-containing protein [Hymenobacter busanensis]